MVLGRIGKESVTPVTMTANPLQQVLEYKLLGVIINTGLKWDGLWALVGEVPRHRRADRPSWDGPTSAVAPGPPRLYVSRLVCRGMRPVSVGLAT